MSETTVYSDSFIAMGTRCDIVFTAVEPEFGEQMFQLVKNEISQLENRLSRFIPTSPIAGLNKTTRNNWLPVPEDIWNVLTICYDFYQMSNGAFDITVAPLVKLWKESESPLHEELENASKISGFDKVEFDFENQKLRFLEDGIEFDLGAIGKGVALDTIKPILQNQGIKNGIISFGESSILALGTHPNGEEWPLGIRNVANTEEFVHVFSTSNQTITTSGSIVIDDDGTSIKRKHIISPASGMPVENKKVISIKSDSATLGEFLSTTFLILPENDKKILLDKFKKVEILEVEYLEGSDFTTKLTIL